MSLEAAFRLVLKMSCFLSIKRLTEMDAHLLSSLLNSAPTEYSRYFDPFSFDYVVLNSILRDSRLDMYYGVFFNNTLVGFYMLRGLDNGFTLPSFGVWISPDFKGKGLATLCLEHAFSVCRLNNISKLMLKVHPENISAKNLYQKKGFVETGVDFENSNIILLKEL